MITSLFPSLLQNRTWDFHLIRLLVNSFEVIGSFSSFENLLPYSTPSRRVTKTNSVTFSCSNWTLSIYDQRGRLFFLPNICGSNHDFIIRTRNLSRSIPLPLILRESERSLSSLNLFIWNLGSSIFYLFFSIYLFFFALFFISFRFSFPLFSFYSFPSFLKSHRFVDPVESDPFSHRAKGTKSIRFLFRSKKSTMWNL